MIFDEAHRVRRHFAGPGRYRATQAYDLAEELKDRVHGLLALTATPMQLHPFELYSLIELIEPGLYPSYEAYDRRRADLPVLNEAMKTLMGWPTLAPALRSAAFEQQPELFAELGFASLDALTGLDDPGVRTEAMESLTAKHPLSEVLMRNRKSQVGGFQPRKATRHLVESTAEEMDLYADVTEYLGTATTAPS